MVISEPGNWKERISPEVQKDNSEQHCITASQAGYNICFKANAAPLLIGYEC